MQAPPRSARVRALVGFVAFGGFWGAWGAALPGVRAHAGVDDGTLGLALLGVGAGALLSMRLTGALVDAHGGRVLPLALVAFAGAAVLPALATSGAGLGAALLAVGATSGAVDVAINAEASRAETGGRPLMNLAHAGFSAAVVPASLLVGGLRGAGLGPLAVLATVSALILVAAAVTARLGGPPPLRSAGARGRRLAFSRPLILLGGLAALSYLVESGWESWSAVHLEVTLSAPPAVAALGPAVFGLAGAVGRLAANAALARTSERRLLAAGAAVGAAGTVLAAVAPGVATALVGIAAAGLGTSVCAPTLIGMAGRGARPEDRGAAVSTVTTVAYLGFLVGPAAVGLVSDAAGLRAGLALLAAVALALAVAVRLVPAGAGASRPAEA